MRLNPRDLGLPEIQVERHYGLVLRSGDHMVLAHVWLDPSGKAMCDDADMQRGWEQHGIRPDHRKPPLYPRHGAVFMDQVALTYQQFPFLWVEIEKD